MKRHKRHLSSLAAVMFLIVPALVSPLPATVSAEDGLHLKSVDFPRELSGECDVIFRVDGNLSSAGDFEAEAEYVREDRSKKKGGMVRSTKVRRHKPKSVDIEKGIVVFHVRFKGKGDRMATCSLHYVMNGKAFKTNQVNTSWFSVTEGAKTTLAGDEEE